MTSIAWSWEEYWSWYEQIEEQERKFDSLRELYGKNGEFIKCLSAESQFKVFLHAPLELKQTMKQFPNLYKREAILMLQMDLDKKNKIARRYRR